MDTGAGAKSDEVAKLEHRVLQLEAERTQLASQLKIVEAAANLDPSDELTPEDIIRKASVHSKYPVEKILGSGRGEARLVMVKQAAAYLMAEMLHLHPAEIGKEMNRDRTTILYSYNQAIESPELQDLAARIYATPLDETASK